MKRNPTLPSKTKEKFEQLTGMLNDPEKTYSENKAIFLIGVYNIKTGKIHLLPCIQKRLWLQIDPSTGKYLRGWEVEKSIFGFDCKGAEIKQADIEKYNKSPYPPRYLLDGTEIGIGSYAMVSMAISPHKFIINLLGENDSITNYRGFSVRNGEFKWSSRSLNQQKNDQRKGSTSSKLMEEQYQGIVSDIIEEYTSIIESSYAESEEIAELEETATNKSKSSSPNPSSFFYSKEKTHNSTGHQKTASREILTTIILESVVLIDRCSFGIFMLAAHTLNVYNLVFGSEKQKDQQPSNFSP